MCWPAPKRRHGSASAAKPRPPAAARIGPTLLPRRIGEGQGGGLRSLLRPRRTTAGKRGRGRGQFRHCLDGCHPPLDHCVPVTRAGKDFAPRRSPGPGSGVEAAGPRPPPGAAGPKSLRLCGRRPAGLGIGAWTAASHPPTPLPPPATPTPGPTIPSIVGLWTIPTASGPIRRGGSTGSGRPRSRQLVLRSGRDQMV